jgi:GH25 family lysozyme M1 (1,4-beta-N-acetylmuramidase)
MIYCNMLWEAFQLDLSELKDIPVWYADYEDAPQTPYNFEFWQYSNEGSVKGIDGAADLNIWMRHK